MIRPAQYHDIAAMLPLLEQLFTIEADFQFDAVRQRCALELLLRSPTARVLVAEWNSRVVAMVTGQLLISTAEGGPALVVEDLVVAKTCQRQGIATRLLEGLTRWARSRGAHRLQLLADQNNATALEFYRGRDWQNTQLICLRLRISEKEET
jgi:ribosomal protein S18 acetylase RimI-like enzyme